MTVEIVKYIAAESATLPTRGSKRAAGWDIYAAAPAELRPYQAVMIPTHIAIEIPENHVYMLFPRSGFSFKNQILIPNSVGVIDEDYRGMMALTVMWTPDPLTVMEIYDARERVDVEAPAGFALRYREDAVFRVKKGDRITQGILLEYKEQCWNEAKHLTPTDRGANGFGSTGLRADDPGAKRG